MGTVVTLDVRADARPEHLATAFAAATDRLDAIDKAFSTWRPDSWVSRLLRQDLSLDDCPREVRDVVRLAERLAERTGGYFTPYWRGDAPFPDPTGLVKGWAAQQASDVLLAHTLGDHVVNAAGDLVVSGAPRAGSGSVWRVGISDPLAPGALAGVVELVPGAARLAVATSGTAELGRHVVDPYTRDHPGSVASATVLVGDDPDAGAVADAWATALVAAGEHAATLLNTLGAKIRGLLVHAGGGVTDPTGLLVPLG
jgi:thiamine biosynthesis lipoprotein